MGLAPVNSTDEAQKYYTKFVCANHFVASDFVNVERRKLNRHALPSVFDATTAVSPHPMMPGCVVQQPVTNLTTILSPASPHVMPVQRVYSKLQKVDNARDESHVADSLMNSSTSETVVNSSTYEGCGSNSVVNSSTFIPAFSSTPKLPPRARCRLDMNVPGRPTMCSRIENESEKLAGSLDGTTAWKSTAPRKKKGSPTLLQSLGVSRVKYLTPRKQKLFRQVQSRVKAVKRVCENLRKKNMTFCDTIQAAEDLQVNELKNLSPTAHHLLVAQLRCKNRKPKGRRWTVDEKLLALSIFKRSPSCYSLLRRMLVLPSRKTLLIILNKVPFRCGVDKKVTSFLKESVSKMNDADRHCVLMFDEMSLKEHVQYCPREDKVIGLVDNGNSRSGDLANYAVVFMVRGLRTKWKQPVACYFTRGGMKGKELKDVIQEVLASCFEIGLKVVATICDMGTNNVSALKELGAKFPDPLFHFQGHEIAVVFDPPHLLKCIRNMFFSHFVRGVKVRGDVPIVGGAKWEHIEKMYEEEKNNIFRIAPKIKDAHVAPTSCERMKVSTAAQTMSHSVAAAMHSYVSRGKVTDCLTLHTFLHSLACKSLIVSGFITFPRCNIGSYDC